MKNLVSLVMKNLVSLVILMLLFASCIKYKGVQTQPAPETMPPYTEIGANTFGCLVDGKVFTPQKKFASTALTLQCDYQFVEGRNQFVLRASDFINTASVGISMDSSLLKQDSLYHLMSYRDNISGQYHSEYIPYYTVLPHIKANYR